MLSGCGIDAECVVTNNTVSCSCPPGFTGNPLIQCIEIVDEIIECDSNADCPDNLACISLEPIVAASICQNPCNCGIDAICLVVNNVPLCSCPDGFIGDPLVECIDTELNACTTNDDCPDDRACIALVCQDPCNCGVNALCVNSIPFGI